jgi:1-deoxy-D-xylulose-5-phosphate reductoisomerase
MNIALIGSTGSIGQKVLEVVRMWPQKFNVVALGTRRNVKKLEEQIKEFKPKVVYIDDLSKKVEGIKILRGCKGIKEICSMEEIDTVIVAVDGYFGIIPSIEAIRNRKKLLTANKESIFIWGYEIIKEAKKYNTIIIPLDSEHNTVFNIISRIGRENVEKILITASGGPFLKKEIKEFESISFDMAMEHPNWKMGKIVTINSSTMFNKFLEVFEAHIFFEMPISEIKIVIHPQSKIHSMVLLKDGTTWAIWYKSDMIFPIASAMFHPGVPNLIDKKQEIDLPCNTSVDFLEPDKERYPILKLLDIIESTTPLERAIINTANEIAIELFEQNKIRFIDITNTILKTFENFNPTRVNVDINGNFEGLVQNMKELRSSIERYIKENLTKTKSF